MYYHQPKITDISMLNSSLEDVTSSLTPIELEVAFNDGVTGLIKAYKVGKIVFVDGQIKYNLSGTNLILASIKNAPSKDGVTIPLQGYGMTNGATAYMESESGSIFFDLPTSFNDYYRFNFSYITQ